MLPEEWEGINGLYEKSENEIKEEVGRELYEFIRYHGYEDPVIGSYTAAEFEEGFNGDDGGINGGVYFIKFFVDGKSVLEG